MDYPRIPIVCLLQCQDRVCVVALSLQSKISRNITNDNVRYIFLEGSIFEKLHENLPLDTICGDSALTGIMMFWCRIYSMNPRRTDDITAIKKTTTKLIKYFTGINLFVWRDMGISATLRIGLAVLGSVSQPAMTIIHKKSLHVFVQML